MNVLLEFVCTEDNQIHGRLHGGDLGEPAAFASWLEFLQLLEALGSESPDGRKSYLRREGEH